MAPALLAGFDRIFTECHGAFTHKAVTTNGPRNLTRSRLENDRIVDGVMAALAGARRSESSHNRQEKFLAAARSR